MGALHAGHYSLLAAARGECGFVAVSIFVNPTQFGPNEDFSKYPRTLESDLEGCRRHGADLAFTPSVEEMYPPGAASSVHVARLGEHLCGASRPGHFDGVCTVVAKLFNIVLPDIAYFGAKDFQQAAIVRKMAGDLDMPPRIVVCPTVREGDGLAMSSRNRRLSPEERAQAPALYEALRLAAERAAAGEASAAALAQAAADHIRRRAPLGRIDYIQVVDAENLAPVERLDRPAVMALAVRFPSARLIDNLAHRQKQ